MKIQMADTKQLTRKWIAYLKRNWIVRKESDPKTGKLAYKRPVTSADLVHFLKAETDFDEETIYAAIEDSLHKAGDSPEPQAGQADDQEENPQSQPEAPQQPQSTGLQTRPGEQSQQQTPKKKWNTDDAEDVDYTEHNGDEPQHNSPPQLHYSNRPNARGGKKAGIVSQTPNAIRKRASRALKKSLKEDFVDNNVNLSEPVVENVFQLLQAKEQEAAQKKKAPPVDKSTNANRIKELIKTGMSSAQRKMLWQALQDTSLTEEQISRAQAKKIFQGVIDNKEYGRLKNKNLTINDLQKVWKDKGFPLDTQDIGDILKRVGFGDKEIHRVFDNVMGGNADYDQDDDQDIPQKPSPAVLKIAEYIQKNGLRDEIIAYMQQEFGEELKPAPPAEKEPGLVGKAMNWAKNKFGKKQATVEEVREIFTAIVLEERTMRDECIKQVETTLLGRSRK